jgi:hypothetical protein
MTIPGKTKHLHDMTLDAYLHDCVTLVPEALQEEFTRVSPDMAYWSRKYSEAHKNFLQAKVAAKRMRALVYIDQREALLSGNVKVTEALIEAKVETDIRVQEADDRLIVAEVERAEADGAMEAVRAKKDMLISIGAHVRAEMGYDPVIREKARERGEIREQQSKG